MKRIEFDKKTVIQKNSKIDRALVKKVEAFERKLSGFGESAKSKYTLTPPLSTSNVYFFNK
tara:strand:- start:242 stop:424 length:183 start_codon:yes stop_codon:yes gene_type:complete